ncbi:protein serine/threonine phosphatase 2C [Ascodesmis nigricans]|uniref:Protein phosphatase n=1 Tax=Ascodesmis nigricans TaxID=341454 RepID=A0A4S2MKH4_9PEZI|nr:protein serine/threonine phosphatase 2C [Ascodesmis nigricans]
MPCTALRSLPRFGLRGPVLAPRTPITSVSSITASSRFSHSPSLSSRPRLLALPLPPRITPIRCYAIAPISKPADLKEQTYRYAISAAFSGKGKRFMRDRNVYRFIPKETPTTHAEEQKRLQAFAGQDAFFVSRMRSDGAVAVGVADGVGGYDEAGINSADFSQGLCSEMSVAAKNTKDCSNPQMILSVGYKQVLHEDKVPGGASTASVGVLRPNGKLAAANLGDSGFIIVRHGKVVYASPAQTHYFNCPLQLSVIPKTIRAHIDKFGGSPYSDSPQDADVSTHDLQNGDVILFATDGIWDNLSHQDLLNIISEESNKAGVWQQGKEGTVPADDLASKVDEDLVASLVAKIVEVAKSRSHNTRIDGPFAKEVQRLYPGENYHGGKVDDICAVCAVVVQA